MALTPKQQRFVDEYIVDLNASAAAKRAGYAQPHSQGSRLLENVEVQAAVTAAAAERAARTRIEADRVLLELARIGTCDLGEAFDKDGKLLPIREMPEGIRRSLSGFEVEALFEGVGQDRLQVGITTKVKLLDKVKALELLGKHLKLFTDKLELGGKVSLEQLVEESYGKEE